MPISFVKLSELGSRSSKITRTSEWVDIEQALAKGIPTGQAIKVTFGEETVELFKKDIKKAALAFAMRLRKDYGEKYKIQLIDKTEIRILSHKEK